jgi:hypothetical protein
MDAEFVLQQAHYFVPCFVVLFVAFLSLFPGTDETLRGKLRAWLLGIMNGSFLKKTLAMLAVIVVVGGWIAAEFTIALGKHKSEKFADEEAVTKSASILSRQIAEFLRKAPKEESGWTLYNRFATRFEGRVDEARKRLDRIGLHSDTLDRLCDWHQMPNSPDARKDVQGIADELKSLSERPLK